MLNLRVLRTVCRLKIQMCSLSFVAEGSAFCCRSEKGQAGMEKEVSKEKPRFKTEKLKGLFLALLFHNIICSVMGGKSADA